MTIDAPDDDGDRAPRGTRSNQLPAAAERRRVFEMKARDSLRKGKGA